MNCYCSPPATKVLNLLVAGLDENNRAKKIDNAPGSFMAVHIEFLGHDAANGGDQFSVAHYYEQNGDLMRDPDVVFIRQVNEQASSEADRFIFMPISFQQDNLGIYNEFFTYDEGGKIQGVRTRMQRDCVSFCSVWLRNIKHQQRLF